MNWSVPIYEPSDEDRRAAMGAKIRHLILTIAGQRCLRREWGSDLASLLFLPAIEPLVSSALRSMIVAVQHELPGILLVTAEAEIDQAEGVVTFVIGWRMVSTNLVGALTVPVGFRDREAQLG